MIPRFSQTFTLSAAILLSVAGLERAVSAQPATTPPAKAAKPATEAFESYAAIVTAEKTPLLCFHVDTAYTIAELQKGAAVRIVGQNAGFLKVQYPGKLTCFVKTSEAKEEGGTVTLTKPSKLWAANALQGISGSWKALLDSELPTGATLKLADKVTEKDGSTSGFRVFAPEGACGFIDPKSVRRATDEEAAKAPAPIATAPIATPASSEPTPTNTTVTPITTSKTTLATPAGTSPPTPTSPTTQPGDAGNDIKPAPAGVALEEAVKRRVAAFETLETKFKAVSAQPVLNAEYDEIRAELQRAIDAEAIDSGRRVPLQRRLDYIALRQDYRDKLRTAEEARAKIDNTNVAVQAEIQKIEATRVYTMIGTLQPSTVYDGKELPLMYRIQSVGSSSPRTLGYLKPDKDFNLDQKLGLVVGVIGNQQIDRALKLNILTPVRVDVLKATAYINPTPGVAVPKRDDDTQQPEKPVTPAQPQTPDPTDK